MSATLLSPFQSPSRQISSLGLTVLTGTQAAEVCTTPYVPSSVAAPSIATAKTLSISAAASPLTYLSPEMYPVVLETQPQFSAQQQETYSSFAEAPMQLTLPQAPVYAAPLLSASPRLLASVAPAFTAQSNTLEPLLSTRTAVGTSDIFISTSSAGLPFSASVDVLHPPATLSPMDLQAKPPVAIGAARMISSPRGYAASHSLSPNLVSYVRAPESIEPMRTMASDSTASYIAGDRVEVWSKSRQAWCPGVVTAVDGDGISVDFMLPDGKAAGKVLPIEGHDELRRPAPVRSRSSSPPNRIQPSSPAAVPRRQSSSPKRQSSSPTRQSSSPTRQSSSPTRQASVPLSVSTPVLDQLLQQGPITVAALDTTADGNSNFLYIGPDRNPDVLQATSIGNSQVVRAYSNGSLPPTQVVRMHSASAPSQPMQLHAPGHVEKLERHLFEVSSALRQAQEHGAAIVSDRDQRLSMQNRLVEDLRSAIDNQRQEAEDLRRQQQELLFTNQEQARRLADLEALLYEIHRDPGLQQNQQQNQEQQQHHHRHEVVDEDDREEVNQHTIALRPPEPHHEHPELLGGDRIDFSLQEFFDMHPDFDIGLTKHKPGWYTFDRPINKKVHIKVTGSNVLVRAGGGYQQLHKWLDQYRIRMSRDA